MPVEGYNALTIFDHEMLTNFIGVLRMLVAVLILSSAKTLLVNLVILLSEVDLFAHTFTHYSWHASSFLALVLLLLKLGSICIITSAVGAALLLCMCLLIFLVEVCLI